MKRLKKEKGRFKISEETLKRKESTVNFTDLESPGEGKRDT